LENIAMTLASHREPQYDIEPLFLSRWSQRAYTGEPVPDDVLFRGFEAARWAPSGGNAQPWRFVYVKRDHELWPEFLGFLNERNQVWAANAAALILLLSRKLRKSDEGERPSRSHSFDAGAAWSNFAHQIHALGWSTRAIGGFDRDAARSALAVPELYELEIFIAVGRPADRSILPAELQTGEQPSTRQPVAEWVAEGRFVFV
jgi:nitroreductase